MVPLAVTLAIVSASSARVSRGWAQAHGGSRRADPAGGLLFMSQMYDVDTAYTTVALGEIILASGMGFAVSPATDSIMGSVPVSKAGIGSAMNDTTRQLGGALGVAVLGTIMNGRYLDGIETLKEALPQLRPDMFEGISSSIQAAHMIASNPQVPEPFATMITGIADQAFVTGMNDAMLFGSAVMLVNALLVLLILPFASGRPAKASPPRTRSTAICRDSPSLATDAPAESSALRDAGRFIGGGLHRLGSVSHTGR